MTDKAIPEDAEIEAHHPMVNGSHRTYEEALRMVSAKHSKGALVELVNWLLQQEKAAQPDTHVLVPREFLERVKLGYWYGGEFEECGSNHQDYQKLQKLIAAHEGETE